jgi:phospholipase C
MIAKYLRMLASILTAISLTLTAPVSSWARPQHDGDGDDFPTDTPIKHVVVIFQENISFDHYFATYPFAKNPPGKPEFRAREDTPRVNNLLSSGLLTENPNSTQPFRLDRTEEVTCDQNHSYGPEQMAFDKGLMDMFPQFVGFGDATAGSPAVPVAPGQPGYCFDAGKGPGVVMGYYDGNTVTAMWNYAQHFAMSDNSFSTNFGPSAVGALNLISGNTGVATLVAKVPNLSKSASAAGNIFDNSTMGQVIGDPRPGYDDCVLTNPGLETTNMVTMVGTNIGDLLNAKGVTWGWFAGGFAPTGTSGRPGSSPASSIDEFGVSRPLAVCGSAHTGLAGNGLVAQPDNVTTVGDYIPHHEPFEYYLQSSNVQHVRPSSPAKIGQDDGAVNHQYDLNDFFTALNNHHLPAVSFLKAISTQDGHPGYSDPLDEQEFVVKTINALMASEEWPETAVIILYDDSDGWYDHAMSPIDSQSSGPGYPVKGVTVFDDNLTGPGNCGTPATTATDGRCGFGPRQPLLVISPWAKENYVDHRVTDQSSVLRFIEDNFLEGKRIGDGSTDAKAGTLNGMFDFDNNDEHGQWNREKDEQHNRTLFLNPNTGEVVNFDADDRR